MLNNSNEFKRTRLTSPLILDDLRVLLGQKGWGSLSRVEAGRQPPTHDMILMYHLIFSRSLEGLLIRDIERMKRSLKKRIIERIDDLKSTRNMIDVGERVRYLEEIYEKCEN